MPLAIALAVVLVLLAALAAVGARVPSLERAGRIGAWVAEGLLVAYVAWDLLGMRDGDRPDNLVTHLGYCLAAVGLIPALTFRPPPAAPHERRVEEAGDQSGEVRAEPDPTEVEPASLIVVAIACLACAAIVLRMAQTR